MAAMEGAARMRAMVFGMWVRFLDTMHFHERTTEGMHLGKWPGPVEEVSVGAVTVQWVTQCWSLPGYGCVHSVLETLQLDTRAAWRVAPRSRSVVTCDQCSASGGARADMAADVAAPPKKGRAPRAREKPYK